MTRAWSAQTERVELRFDCGALRGRPALLMFHRVLPRAELSAHLLQRPRFEVSTDHFAQVLDSLTADGYCFVTLDAMARRLAQRRRVRHLACITFDDGFSDVVSHALPVLERRGVPFAVYVTTGYPDGQLLHVSAAIEDLVRNSDQLELELPAGPLRLPTRSALEKAAAVTQLETAVFAQFPTIQAAAQALGFEPARFRGCTLSWEQVARLSQHPLCTIGAHTVSHRDLTRATRAEIRWEIEESNRRLQQVTGFAPRHFAYPFGRYNELAREEAMRAGYSLSVKTGRACIDPDDVDLAAAPRVCALETTESS